MDVWVLGATGRSGRRIIEALGRRDVEAVPVGRDRARLAAAFPDAARTVVAGSVAEMAERIRGERPTVVVNTVGPFTTSAETVARACLPHSHYLDLANDACAFAAVLDLHERAVEAGRSLVPGAGFGVAATESVVTDLCAGLPTPRRVRTAMIPSVASEAGVVGEALAATVVDLLPAGGRRYVDGALRRVTPGHDAETLTLPDGSRVVTAGMPFGELVAARRASGAPDVVATSTMAPHGAAMRALLPPASLLASSRPLRTVLTSRLAELRTPARERPREHSYGHARVTWADGTVREGWLRTGDASDFTVAVAAEVATRLAAGRGRPGAHTPVAAVGLDLVAAAGAELLDQPIRVS